MFSQPWIKPEKLRTKIRLGSEPRFLRFSQGRRVFSDSDLGRGPVAPACFVALLIHHLEEHTTHEIGPLSEDRMVYEKWLAKAQKYSFEIVC